MKRKELKTDHKLATETVLRAADLFCGAGGLTLACNTLPIDVLVSADNWKCAITTHKKNFRNDVIELDLSDVSLAIYTLQNYALDLIMGGPPCQDFSSAGLGIEGDRANLTFSFAKIVTSLSPRLFLMENVPSALSSNAYQRAKELLEESHYKLAEFCVDAAYFGVPQHRRRLIVIGSKEKDPKGIEEYLAAYASTLPMPITTYWPDINLQHYYRHPRSYARRAVFSTAEPSPTIRGVNRPRPASYTAHEKDSTTEPVRSLTSLERARLQSFPEQFIWDGTNTEIEQMIGNSVPPLLGQRVLQSLIDWDTQKPERIRSFRFWLQKEAGLSTAYINSHFGTLRTYTKKHRRYPGENENDFLLRIRHELATSNMPSNQMSRTKRILDLYFEFTLTQSEEIKQ